ncbi:uncharacterized protein LOC124636075 [Helicoverpa zea]|uniref:uncharacterized protein LOC124636075 n=1 Tax=Helicoverpa zea TaxID=7113 RepID=UPI001F55E884|nr:uncharacterized protein LOC124636075 [Helicoverpa zea]
MTIVELSSKKTGCRIDDVSVNNISYADDMVLLSPTVRALRELLKVCEDYAQMHGLSYNVRKSELLVFKADGGKCPESVPVVKLSGHELKRVYQFKYLGHYVTDDLNDHVDIERERRALAVRCNMLVRRFARCSASGMFAQAHFDDFYAIIRKKSASLLYRVRGSPNSIMRTIAERYDSPIIGGIVRNCITRNNLVSNM